MSRTTQYHLFSLPPELLETLTPRNLFSQTQESKEQAVQLDKTAETQSLVSGSRSCNICMGATFSDVEDQRLHFRSDWHRYNVKVRLANGKAVSEAEFAILVEGLEDSLSGSATSSEDEDASDSDTVNNLLLKARIQSRPSSPTLVANIPQTALLWFHRPPSTQIGIYRTIFPTNTPRTNYLSELHAMQKPISGGRKWTLFMVAGGHFAGVVVRVSKAADVEEAPVPKGKQKKPVPEMEILRHKTFHRYTTRRKQGGSQSLNDNAKGNAKSAGAQLRRYGEQALREDIRGLIEDWAEDIGGSERIWIRASGANRKIFMDYDGAVISKGDERLRAFPFPTRRPTQAELSRCLMELTKVKVTHFTEEELQEQDEAFRASLSRPKPLPVAPSQSETKPAEKKVPKLSKEEEIIREKLQRFIDMIKKGRLEPAKSFWEREGTSIGGIDVTIPEWTGERVGTLLQLATSAGQGEVVAWLLDDLHADPTVPVPSGAPETSEITSGSRPNSPAPPRPSGTHRTAYDLASSKAVRDVFRRSAAARPTEWDWLGAAHIPSALSKEMEEERDTKKRERRKGLKDKIREREAKERERTPEPEPVPTPVQEAPPKGNNARSGPQKLGGASAVAKSTEGLVGLTPEMRAKIERERRARAAEARFKARGGG